MKLHDNFVNKKNFVKSNWLLFKIFSFSSIEEGSGDSNSVDNFKPTKPNNNNGNNNYNDPYNNNYGMNSNVNNNFGGTNSNVPTNNWSGNTNTGGGSDPYNMNPDNNQPKLEVCDYVYSTHIY